MNISLPPDLALQTLFDTLLKNTIDGVRLNHHLYWQQSLQHVDSFDVRLAFRLWIPEIAHRSGEFEFACCTCNWFAREGVQTLQYLSFLD